MGLFSNVGYSGMNIKTEEAMPKGPSDKWQKGFEQGPPIGSVPRLFYSLFIHKYGMQWALNSARSKVLEDVLPFIQDEELKKNIYKQLRSRVFQYKSGKSVIINELTGIIEFAKNSVLYGIATLKIHIG